MVGLLELVEFVTGKYGMDELEKTDSGDEVIPVVNDTLLDEDGLPVLYTLLVVAGLLELVESVTE